MPRADAAAALSWQAAAMSRWADDMARAADARHAVAAVASDAARLLLDLDPVLADDATQVTVDAFVEQAAAALESLASWVTR